MKEFTTTLYAMLLLLCLTACQSRDSAMLNDDIIISDPYAVQFFRDQIAPSRWRSLPEYSISIEALELKAREGDPVSKLVLFDIYLRGVKSPEADTGVRHIVKRDYCTAANWIHSAAQDGLTPAMMWTSNLYRSGVGVEEDLENAYLWHLGWLQNNNISVEPGSLQDDSFGLSDPVRESLKLKFKSSQWWLERKLALASCPEDSLETWHFVIISDALRALGMTIETQ